MQLVKEYSSIKFILFVLQMLAESLLACHASSVAAGTPLALEVFVSGRGRLEDEGATELAKAFKVLAVVILLSQSMLFPFPTTFPE